MATFTYKIKNVKKRNGPDPLGGEGRSTPTIPVCIDARPIRFPDVHAHQPLSLTPKKSK
jgi:hypothetical protein